MGGLRRDQPAGPTDNQEGAQTGLGCSSPLPHLAKAPRGPAPSLGSPSVSPAPEEETLRGQPLATQTGAGHLLEPRPTLGDKDTQGPQGLQLLGVPRAVAPGVFG